MPSTQTLSAQNLSCIRGEKTLFSQLDFTVESGDCLHITGPNGSGKTSLLRIIAGVNSSETGQVSWNNTDTRSNMAFLETSAYLAHKDGLKNELTSIENLRYYQQLANQQSITTDYNSEEQLDTALARMQILQCADLTAQQLSFGQRRRLAFARLIISKFSLWILDEPFTGIDTAGRELIELLCVEHLQRNGLILMTHHQSLEHSGLNAYRKELRLANA